MERKSKSALKGYRATVKNRLLFTFILALFLSPHGPAHAWECEVTLTAPKTIKIGQTVTLSASGSPADGAYSWSRIAQLTPNGSSATLTGYKPSYSEYIGITATYRSPKGKSCADTKWIWVCMCTVGINGPSQAKVGEPITLAATGTPADGIYEWTVNAGSGSISGTGEAVTFTGDQQGEVEIKVSYTPPEGGEPCTYYHTVNVNCTIEISGPSQSKVGELVTLAATADPPGGVFHWSIATGSGTLTNNGSTATFVGDQAGDITIALSYTSPQGEILCDSTHTIKVNEECSVAIAGIFNIPNCRVESFSANGLPNQGTCIWEGNGISSTTGCSVTYGSSTPGYHNLSVTYLSPGGSTCVDTKSVLSYRLDAMTPKAFCYESGANLTLADFDIFTTPSTGSFRDNIALTPTTVSTWLQQATVLVNGSYFCPNEDAGVNIPITVINKDVKQKANIKIEIPNLLKTPLQAIGIADRLNFNLTNSYDYYKECCPSGPASSASGKTSVSADIKVEGFTLLGVTLPKVVKQYVTIDVVNIGASGGGGITLKAEKNGCSTTGTEWSGSGKLGLSASAGSEVKAITPKDIFVMKGSLKGNTSIAETITVKTTTATATGTWGEFSMAGEVVLKTRFAKGKLKLYQVKIPLSDKRPTPAVDIPLPNL